MKCQNFLNQELALQARLAVNLSIEKTKVVFDFDADSLKELRKVLFKKGLSPQQFLSYVIELVSLRDARLDLIMQEAVENRASHHGKNRKNTTDAETIYDLIKKGLGDKN